MEAQLQVSSRPIQVLTDEQKNLVKRTVAKGATDDELALFLHYCSQNGFDPLGKDVYFRKHRNRTTGEETITFITSIDTFRARAEASGNYAGNDDPIFDNEQKPTKATVTVYKIVGGERCGFQASARWDQYYPGDTQGHMWRKMPHLMLGKCAEALALRKAFPKQLKGLYVKEEMEQAGNDAPAPQTSPNENLTRQLRAGVNSMQPQPQRPIVALPPDDNDIPLPPEEHEPNAPENRDESAGNYIITFGKYKGKSIADVGIPQVVSYLAWVQSTAKKSGKPMSQDAQELYLYSKAFAEGKSVQEVEMEGLPI